MVRRRRAMGWLAAVPAVTAVTAWGTAACAPGQAAAPAPTATPDARPTPAPEFVAQVRLTPQEPRAGQDEKVVIGVSFRNRQNRPVAGAQMSAVVNYPGGPKTYTSDITTFPDGRLDLAVDVAPATRGQNVPIEVVMRYQGQEYRSRTGFTVR